MARRSNLEHCSVDGCAEPQHSRGLCTRHYQRLLRHGNPTTILRPIKPPIPLPLSPHRIALFEAKIDKSGDCWVWTGSTVRGGYGQFSLGRINGKTVIALAHRVSLLIHTGGQIPDGMHACHHCDNPPCVNPAHLFIGTNSDNQRDRIAKGRGGRLRAA